GCPKEIFIIPRFVRGSELRRLEAFDEPPRKTGTVAEESSTDECTCPFLSDAFDEASKSP
ncbi:hypothetical protein Pmar_PMAR006078, partial [Perkinsus marinus ATCC 50983]